MQIQNPAGVYADAHSMLRGLDRRLSKTPAPPSAIPHVPGAVVDFVPEQTRGGEAPTHEPYLLVGLPPPIDTRLVRDVLGAPSRMEGREPQALGR
jgi:hypothetical protein